MKGVKISVKEANLSGKSVKEKKGALSSNSGTNIDYSGKKAAFLTTKEKHMIGL